MTLDKEKLLNDLKAQIGNIDNKNDLRLVYQIGRNSIASYFFRCDIFRRLRYAKRRTEIKTDIILSAAPL